MAEYKDEKSPVPLAAVRKGSEVRLLQRETIQLVSGRQSGACSEVAAFECGDGEPLSDTLPRFRPAIVVEEARVKGVARARRVAAAAGDGKADDSINFPSW